LIAVGPRDRPVQATEPSACEGDWHRAYEAAKSWIVGGGGAQLPDPWLVYAASALLHGQPRIAVHSIDSVWATGLNRRRTEQFSTQFAAGSFLKH